MANATIKFENTSRENTASIYLMDDENNEVYVGDVSPSESSEQNTDLGDEWIVKAKSNGSEIGSVTVTSNGQTYKILWSRGDAGLED